MDSSIVDRLATARGPILGRLLPGALLALLLVAAVAIGMYLATRDEAQAGPKLVRWGNVTIQAPPADSPWLLGTDLRDGLTLVLKRRAGDGGYVRIDATSGAILHDDVQTADRGVVDSILGTITLSDESSMPVSWPYSTASPDAPRSFWGNVSYIAPDPMSGIIVRVGYGYGSGPFLQITNGKSLVSI